jgi:Holliday junction resolvase RusA-like endonuclease
MSKPYRDWVAAAGTEIMIQKQRVTLGKVGISVQLCPPDKRRRDLDNVGFKAIIDLLVKHGLIEGDDSRYVRSLRADWVDEGHPCVVTIKPAVFC